jgi:RsiW-degrading membrane proteinase PrsW (M82 family)
VSISITCPACGQRLKGKDELAGKVLPCPKCKHELCVPPPEDEPDGYHLQSEETDISPPPPESDTAEEEEQTAGRRGPGVTATRPRKDLSGLPPLTTNDPPLWLRHLHWLLILALLPLAFSLLHSRDEDDLRERFARTLQEAPEESQRRVFRILEQMEKGESSREDLFKAMPGHKLSGALLARDSFAHWGFAAGSTVLFMAFFLVLSAQKTADPVRLLVIGVFTATIGILLLLLLQVIADWSQGIWLRGGNIVVVIFYLVKLIGFSYRAALDPENGFLLSFVGYTLGVGFCEEVCKALPLLWQAQQSGLRYWRTSFLWGLASGAGFGISEGVLYSSRYYNGFSGVDMYVVRFISCVALHALWTGSVAITLQQKQSLLQGVESWYEYIPRLYLIVGVPMILHGLYDTLLKKEMNALALGVAILSFGYLAFQISRLHGGDDKQAKEDMLREYQRRRAAMS